MISQDVVIDGKVCRLGKRIGKGGEGEIYLHGSDKSLAIKLYTLTDLADRPAKVRALVRDKLADKAPLASFPISEVSSPSGAFLGFAMRLVAGYQPLHELYAPGPRKLHFGQADYRFLVRTATNIARAVASVHQSGCVIGDINHSGILVSPKAVVALIDADSFQFTSAAQQFLCKVGVPEYTPPELQGKSLVGVQRTANHDAFGLAVVIFQLLFMGRHPFVGTVRSGDIPPLHENIRDYRYVYTDARNVGMDQPPGTPSVADFFPPLGLAFDHAFSKETASQRPSAAAWAAILKRLEDALVCCDKNPLHYIPKSASECAWCEMERQLGTFLFVPHVPAATLLVSVDPGASRFDLAATWAQILQVKAATDVRLTPRLPSDVLVASDAAQRAKEKTGHGAALGLVLIVAALIGMVTVPKGFVLWLLLFFAGIGVARSKRTVDATAFTTGFVASEQLLSREIDNWNLRNGTVDFLKLYTELENAKLAYDSTLAEEAREVSRNEEQRRSSQLGAYLSSFTLAKATIRGVGPATRAVLNSFGIGTAEDIVDGRVQNVPGIGPAMTKKLLDWRRRLERQFVYRPDTAAGQRTVALVARQKAESTLAPLRAKLLAGPQNLLALAARMRQIASTEDALLSRAKRGRDQARVDLEFLGVAVPTVPVNRPRPAQPATAVSTPSQRAPRVVTTPSTQQARAATAVSSSTTATCPRCGYSMTKRLARRGANAGGYFWGCTRYPACRGTRSV